jgi:hypothetical protein
MVERSPLGSQRRLRVELRMAPQSSFARSTYHQAAPTLYRANLLVGASPENEEFIRPPARAKRLAFERHVQDCRPRQEDPMLLERRALGRDSEQRTMANE